jgi:hypothetical protein
MPRQKPDIPGKTCKGCGKSLTRRRYASGQLENYDRYLVRQHCSRACEVTRKEEVTSQAYHKRAHKVIAREACEECGTTESLGVHHIDRNPANNDISNLMVLCARHHKKLHWREDREKLLKTNPFVVRSLGES